MELHWVPNQLPTVLTLSRFLARGCSWTSRDSFSTYRSCRKLRKLASCSRHHDARGHAPHFNTHCYHERTSKTHHERLPAHVDGLRRGHRSRRGDRGHHRDVLARCAGLEYSFHVSSFASLLSPPSLTSFPPPTTRRAQRHFHRFRASRGRERGAVARLLRQPRGFRGVHQRQPNLRRASGGAE
jgi:hypothetical protein